jgi:hypothetical protein
MSDVHTILIDDARQVLLREISPIVGRKDLYEAFAAWLVPNAIPGLGINGAMEIATQAAGAERTYHHVAVLGLVAQLMNLAGKAKEALHSGLNWVVCRDPVVGGTPMGFCMDGIALVALLLGAKATGDTDVWHKTCQWIQRCREVTAGGQGLGIWQEWLLATIGVHTGLRWDPKGDDGPYAAEVRVALRSKGFGVGDPTPVTEKDEYEVLNLIHRESSSDLGVPHAAIRLAALDWVGRVRPITDLRNVTIPDLCNLLRRVPSGLKKWTWENKPRTRTAPKARKWHVDNEYHVQNLLWLLLAPIFPDLIDEDATPKVGPLQPRADICIPSLRVIVEVKFMRNSDTPKAIIEQIAEDASLYLVLGSKYDSLIPFIWDDSRRTEHHEEIIRGLRQLCGVIDTIIIPRPGSMALADGGGKVEAAVKDA